METIKHKDAREQGRNYAELMDTYNYYALGDGISLLAESLMTDAHEESQQLHKPLKKVWFIYKNGDFKTFLIDYVEAESYMKNHREKFATKIKQQQDYMTEMIEKEKDKAVRDAEQQKVWEDEERL